MSCYLYFTFYKLVDNIRYKIVNRYLLLKNKMLMLCPLLLVVGVQVLGQDIDNGVLDCGDVWCQVRCNYGYIPTGDYFVTADQTSGRITHWDCPRNNVRWLVSIDTFSLVS